MLDEDRFTGLTQEEIEEVIDNHIVMNDLDHSLMMIEGLCSIIEKNYDVDKFAGIEHYFIGGMTPYAYVGNESAFWDKFKESSKKVLELIKEAIKKITDYFDGDGQKQVEETEKKLKEAIETLKSINGSIPVPEDHPLLNKEKYFKEPKIEGLGEDDSKIVKKAIEDMNSAINTMERIKSIGDLVAGLELIGNTSIKAAKSIAEQIKKNASEANKTINEAQSPDIPKDDEPKEVQESKKEEAKQDLNEAKNKGNEIKRLASIRNKFLAPAIVVVNSVSQVQKLKDNKEFKG